MITKARQGICRTSDKEMQLELQAHFLLSESEGLEKGKLNT